MLYGIGQMVDAIKDASASISQDLRKIDDIKITCGEMDRHLREIANRLKSATQI